MFSNANARQADMCRFCWMCRHICPVAGATGSEGWGPRARGLMVSMIERGTPYDAEIADAMYHCTMCDACANDCVTGWKPTDFIREARMLAVVNEIAPPKITKEIENIVSCGNIYGEEEDPSFLRELAGLPEQSEVLLYIGQTGRTRGASTAISFMHLLKKAGISFTVLKKEPPTGAFLMDLMGLTGDVQNTAAAAAEEIKASGAKTVVALSPYDAVMLRNTYAEWNLLDGINVVSAPAFIADAFKSHAIKAKKIDLTASVQEPVKLTRGLGEEEPINQIIKELGIHYLPLFLHGKMARCIGTPIMDLFDPDVTRHMVEVRCDDAKRIDSPAIIACSPDDYTIMKKYASEGIEIIDLFSLLDGNC